VKDVGRRKPPQPEPDASTAATYDGARGTKEVMGMGWSVSDRARWDQSVREDLTSGVRWSRCALGLFDKRCCRMEKRKEAPRIAVAMWRSSPSNCCHWWREVRAMVRK
jgi:hypothetical protein